MSHAIEEMTLLFETARRLCPGEVKVNLPSAVEAKRLQKRIVDFRREMRDDLRRRRFYDVTVAVRGKSVVLYVKNDRAKDAMRKTLQEIR